ncbi:hypothetical protein Ahy_B10g100341 isoform B [Arachis hypogaea]|uniref:Serine/threonine specific protein phosphatases domain-containing protein n=1 Tax=Arachis hypogaea TaxID=3818 RepID=A0A444WWD3_ARAHY|nr:hypothetical protein Ahy_B10g100341 isoform B [Arachis hypogaea]
MIVSCLLCFLCLCLSTLTSMHELLSLFPPSQLVIRSHEGPDAREKRDGLDRMSEGYTIDHVVDSGKLITLFSAPDYPQFQATEERYNNKGAYVVLEPPNFDNAIFHGFTAVTPRPKVNAYYNFEEVIDSDEELDLESMVTS